MGRENELGSIAPTRREKTAHIEKMPPYVPPPGRSPTFAPLPLASADHDLMHSLYSVNCLRELEKK